MPPPAHPYSPPAHAPHSPAAFPAASAQTAEHQSGGSSPPSMAVSAQPPVLSESVHPVRSPHAHRDSPAPSAPPGSTPHEMAPASAQFPSQLSHTPPAALA